MFGVFGSNKTNQNEEFTYILLWGTKMMQQYDPLPMLNDKLAGLLAVAAKDVAGYVFPNMQIMRQNGRPYRQDAALFGMPCAIQIMLPIAEVKKLVEENPQALYSHIKRIYPLAQDERFSSVDIIFNEGKFAAKEQQATLQRCGSGLNSYNNLTRI